jgi:hypothetical protein
VLKRSIARCGLVLAMVVCSLATFGMPARAWNGPTTSHDVWSAATVYEVSGAQVTKVYTDMGFWGDNSTPSSSWACCLSRLDSYWQTSFFPAWGVDNAYYNFVDSSPSSEWMANQTHFRNTSCCDYTSYAYSAAYNQGGVSYDCGLLSGSLPPGWSLTCTGGEHS